MSNDRMQRQRFEQKYMLDEDKARAIWKLVSAQRKLRG